MNRVIVRLISTCSLILVVGSFVGNRSAAAQAGIYAYPRNGQSQAQQQRDEFECHQWAVQQSGFNPITAAQTQGRGNGREPRDSSPGFLGIGGDRNLIGGEGNVLSDAATGAAVGAAGGAIAGDAGLGALIGAGVSAVFGDIVRSGARNGKRRSERALPDYQTRLGDYRRAYSVCLSGRNYQVS